MRKNNLLYMACGFFMLAASSCEDLLTEKPDSYYEKSNYFVSESNAEMAVIGVYDVLASTEHYGQFEMAMPSSDDMYFIQGTTSDNTRRDISHYQLTPNNEWIYGIWKHKYTGIDRANYAIEGITSMAGYKDNPTLQKLAGEARFLRAMLAFDLVRYFGDVPFKTSYSSSYDNASQPRSDRELIYDQIIQDLDFAKSTLDWADASSSPERATQGAARALLMRVLLQRAGYSLKMDGKLSRPDDATRKACFEAVIAEWEAFEKQGYHDFYDGGYTELFKSFSAGTLNSKESIWEIAFYSPNGNGKDNNGVWATYNGPAVEAPSGIASTETGNYMGRANAFFYVLPTWKDYFEEGDERRDVTVCTYQYKWDKETKQHVKYENDPYKYDPTDPEKSKIEPWYPGKWRREWMPIGYIDPNNTGVNYCYLRYGDVVLMAAEAYNETGNTPEAWRLLNLVRQRAGATEINDGNYASFYKAPKVLNLSFIDDTDTQGKFRTALYWERAFEMAFEGTRKYDLLRWGILKEALRLAEEQIAPRNWIEIEKPMYVAGTKFQTGKHELFPIPLDEMQLNKKLEGIQNPGY